MATAALERDPIAELGIKLISADNHINEPRNLFIDRFPRHLKDRAPRVIEGLDGGEGWAIDGRTPIGTLTTASPSRSMTERATSPRAIAIDFSRSAVISDTCPASESRLRDPLCHADDSVELLVVA